MEFGLFQLALMNECEQIDPITKLLCKKFLDGWPFLNSGPPYQCWPIFHLPKRRLYKYNWSCFSSHKTKMNSPSPTIITYSMCILVVPNIKNDSKRFLANSFDNSSSDIFVKFPIELLIAIFVHLSHQDLLNLEAVCPRLKQIIRRNIWPIERKMIFTRENGTGFIKQFIAQRGQFIREFELDGMADEEQKIEELIPLMLAECEQIQRIGILNVNLEQRNSILIKLKENFG